MFRPQPPPAAFGQGTSYHFFTVLVDRRTGFSRMMNAAGVKVRSFTPGTTSTRSSAPPPRPPDSTGSARATSASMPQGNERGRRPLRGRCDQAGVGRSLTDPIQDATDARAPPRQLLRSDVRKGCLHRSDAHQALEQTIPDFEIVVVKRLFARRHDQIVRSFATRVSGTRELGESRVPKTSTGPCHWHAEIISSCSRTTISWRPTYLEETLRCDAKPSQCWFRGRGSSS